MIVLVGFMGSGKTSVGRALAAALGLPFIDTDELVEATAGRAIAEIFRSEGEPTFRALERAAITEALAGEDAVIAVGGGALTDPRTRTDLGWHDVVHLDVAFGEAMRRISGDARRPMLASADPKALYDERRPHYERVARATVTTDGKTPAAAALEVARLLGREVSGSPRRVLVKTVPAYEVVVGDGFLGELSEFFPALPGAEAAFLITHPDLATLAAPVVAALESKGLTVHELHVPAGESSKSLARASELYDALARASAHRGDVVVAVGGGVVTDLAGFVASTYNRGMRVVHVGTTLLAQVDAAIGGKTGVNLAAGKNLVGTIHQPALVACDVSLLRSLPEEEFTSGLAEVAKYGFIQEPDLLDVLLDRGERLRARSGEDLVEIVARSVSIKAGVVASDEREQNVREILNYGHTFGHAIERLHGYSIRHGHAVALGMMAAAHLAHVLRRIEADVVHRHEEVLAALGLPVRAALDIADLEEAWVRDKKYRGGVRFVLLAGLGKAETGVRAPRAAIEEALERMRS